MKSLQPAHRIGDRLTEEPVQSVPTADWKAAWPVEMVEELGPHRKG